jgi:hypothetical protein
LRRFLRLQKDPEARNADRRLTRDQQTLLKDCLKLTPGNFSISALGDDAEAYDYAQDWHDILIAAGWELNLA